MYFEGCGVYGSKEMEPTTTGKKGTLTRNKRPKRTRKRDPESNKKWTMQRENESAYFRDRKRYQKWFQNETQTDLKNRDLKGSLSKRSLYAQTPGGGPGFGPRTGPGAPRLYIYIYIDKTKIKNIKT